MFSIRKKTFGSFWKTKKTKQNPWFKTIKKKSTSVSLLTDKSLISLKKKSLLIQPNSPCERLVEKLLGLGRAQPEAELESHLHVGAPVGAGKFKVRYSVS